MKRTRVIFAIIFFIAVIIRIYNLSNIPASLHIDEASIGYNAYSILTSGKDEHGVTFPVFFKAFGEYKSPVEIYSTIPFIFLFGLNEFSVRITSVIYGLLGIVAIYLVTNELFKKNNYADFIALTAMFFLAISPWDIQFSRIAWEMMPFVFFTTFGLYLFLKAQTVPKLLPFAITSFCLSVYSYFVAWLFIPIFGLMILVLYYRFFLKNIKETVISLVLLLLLFVPIFNDIALHGLKRWQQVSIFSNPPANESIVQHIKINYFQHFSVEYLFTNGDIGMPGQPNTYDSVKGMGELYIFQLPLLLIGLYKLFKQKDKTSLILLLWLLLYPLGSMFTTRPSPLARRSVIGVIPIQIISALGLIYLFQLTAKIKSLSKILVVFTILIISLSFAYYLVLYFADYTSYSSDYYGFQFGSKQIVTYFGTHESMYDDLIMSPYIFSPYIYFDFYSPNDCRKCESGLPEKMFNRNRKQLYALPPYYMTSHTEFVYKPLENIYYPNGTVAFILTQITGEK